jgi:hypothetical protein
MSLGRGIPGDEHVLVMGAAAPFGTVLDFVDEDLGFADTLQVFGAAVRDLETVG